jgi:hypothetical protein
MKRIIRKLTLDREDKHRSLITQNTQNTVSSFYDFSPEELQHLRKRYQTASIIPDDVFMENYREVVKPIDSPKSHSSSLDNI